MSSPLRLIFRCDDAGSARSANLAILESCQKGVGRNAGVMAPGLAFEHALEVFADVPPEVCGLGLHVTLSSEWDAPKWGPVLPVSQVPSLVDEQGFFTTTPNVLHDRGFSVDEALAEIEAQLQRTLEGGLRLEYVDEHMGISWIDPKIRAGIAAMAQRHGLLDTHGVPGLPPPPESTGDIVTDWIASLEHLAANGGGTFVAVTHPTLDDAEMHAYHGLGREPGVIAHQRDLDRRALLDPRLREACDRLGVELIRYAHLAKS